MLSGDKIQFRVVLFSGVIYKDSALSALRRRIINLAVHPDKESKGLQDRKGAPGNSQIVTADMEFVMDAQIVRGKFLFNVVTFCCEQTLFVINSIHFALLCCFW